MTYYVIYMPTEDGGNLCRSVTVRNGKAVISSAFYSAPIPALRSVDFRVRVALKTR